jgi:hypothetical protein
MKKIYIGLIFSMVFLFNAIQAANAAEKKTWVYVITNGDNLWNITTKFLTKIDYYTKLQKLNNIKHPKKLKPGSIIRIPMEWIKHTPASAKVSFLQGQSQLFRNNELTPLTPATILVLGDEVRTGTKGSATVIFADGSEIVLFKNTVVVFDHLSAYGKTGMVDTRIRVIQGKVETNAQKNKGPGSRLDISTPSAISSVRGTFYRVSNTKENASTVEVIEGTVEVAGDKQKNSIEVATGQGTLIEEGREPTPPTPLLSPPTILTTQIFFETTPLISWVNVKKAKYYNFQVSLQKNFKSILWSKSTTGTSIELPELTDGIYYYRITATDQLGIEGIAVQKKLTIDLSPKAPKLINTPHRVLSDDLLSVLRWENSADKANSYKVELAKDKMFTQPTLTKIVTSTEFPLPQNLTFGDYFWRVSSIKGSEKNIDIGPASSPLPFNWTTRIAPPECNVIASSDAVNIKWSPIKKEQTLTIEIADETSFSETIKTYHFNSNTSSVEFNANEGSFVRCKLALTDTLIESQWGNTQQIPSIDKSILSMFGILLLVILI